MQQGCQSVFARVLRCGTASLWCRAGIAGGPEGDSCSTNANRADMGFVKCPAGSGASGTARFGLSCMRRWSCYAKMRSPVVFPLERGQARVDRAEARAGAGGHVGAREQALIQHRENVLSRHITRGKHNDTAC